MGEGVANGGGGRVDESKIFYLRIKCRYSIVQSITMRWMGAQ